jgi:hypothetical protein
MNGDHPVPILDRQILEKTLMEKTCDVNEQRTGAERRVACRENPSMSSGGAVTPTWIGAARGLKGP